jgi:hypothetical protein
MKLLIKIITVWAFLVFGGLLPGLVQIWVLIKYFRRKSNNGIDLEKFRKEGKSNDNIRVEQARCNVA